MEFRAINPATIATKNPDIESEMFARVENVAKLTGVVSLEEFS